MSSTVDEYGDIKYSLQPHGLKSKVLAALVFFVVAFGGALLYATPAQAAPGDVTCYVEVTPDPTVTPAPTPAPTSPTPCPTVTVTAPPVTITSTVNVPGPVVTVTETKTITKTVYITQPGQTQTVTVTETQPAASLTPQPSETPPPVRAQLVADDDRNPLIMWGAIVAGIIGLVLLAIAIVSFRQRRRYRGRHVTDEDETTVMEPVRDEYSIRDYDPSEGDYDPALGGYAGETYNDETKQIPTVKGGTDTQVMPPVE